MAETRLPGSFGGNLVLGLLRLGLMQVSLSFVLHGSGDDNSPPRWLLQSRRTLLITAFMLDSEQVTIFRATSIGRQC